MFFPGTFHCFGAGLSLQTVGKLEYIGASGPTSHVHNHCPIRQANWKITPRVTWDVHPSGCQMVKIRTYMYICFFDLYVYIDLYLRMRVPTTIYNPVIIPTDSAGKLFVAGQFR